MLKIIKLSLISKQQAVRLFDFSNNINFIKMGNSKGKTSLFTLIDYLLGSSSITLSQQTFHEIDSAELYTNHGIFIRSIIDKNYFGFKLRQNDGLQVVSEDYYKNQIENACLDGVFSERDSVRALADENISFRTYTMFNFLDEHYLGQIEKNIFSKQTLFEYYRGKYIFDYVFNKNNINRINLIKNEIEELNKKNASSDAKRHIQKNKQDRVRSIFAELGINFKINDNKKNIEELIKYESELLMSNSRIKEAEDYYYLWDILNNVTNTLRKLKEQKLSIKKQNELNEKRIMLLKSLKELFDGSSGDNIIEPIIELISKCEMVNIAAENSDFNETINELEKRRKEIQKEIYSIKAANSDINIETKRMRVAEAKVLIDDINSFIDKDIPDYEELIKQKKKEIRELRNSYDVSMEDKVSSLINYYYSSLKGKGYEFIEKDYEKNNFRLHFSYKKMTVFGYTTMEAENGKRYDVVTMPESMSRQTVIQLCTYFAFNHIFKTDFKFPIICSLFLDNVTKPLENANKPIIYDLLVLFTNEVKDFNVIVTTDCDEDNRNTSKFYEEGLNPLFV